MVSLLLKNWRFLLDALLIIGLVVLVFVLNPFGIFGNGLSLGTTANMVTDIKQIGQLVTAEYYGEVISSLDESRLVLIEEDSTQQQANQHYSEIKYALFDLYQYQQIPRKERTQEYRNRGDQDKVDNWRRKVQHQVNRRNIREKLDFLNLLDSLVLDPLHQPVIEFLWREKYGHSEKGNWNPNERVTDEVLFTTYTELAEKHQPNNNEAFQQYLEDGFDFPADYQAFAFDDQVAELSRAERKKKLTLVGRGWVKAGFDFQSLDENSFYFHEESGELHFFGLEPQILNADINPWFIPQRGIPGFEVIDYHGKVNFKDAQRVKQHCIDKLVAYAHRADIIGQAQQQGAETLKSFFSLITGEEVTEVHFHNDLLTQTFKEVGRDEFISYYEGVLIDSVLRKERAITDSLRRAKTNWTKNQQLANERDSLQKKALAQLLELPFEGSNEPFNYYSVLSYRVVLDSIIDQYEQQELQQARWQVGETDNHQRLSDYKNPQYWYQDTLALMSQFNATLESIEESKTTVGTVKTARFAQDPDSLTAFTNNPQLRIIDFYLLEDTTYVRYLDTVRSEDESWLTQQYFPFRYTTNLFEELNRTDSLLLVSPLDSTSAKFSRTNPDKFWIYNTMNNQLMTINLPMDSLLLIPALQSVDSIFQDSLYLIINSDSVLLDDILLSSDTLASLVPKGELTYYFTELEKSYQREVEKGPIVRASEWFRQQLGMRPDSLNRVNQIRDYLSSFGW